MADKFKAATMKELAIALSKKQEHEVECLTEESPILESMRFEPSTHELWNVAAVTTRIDGAGFVPINSPLPNMKTSQELKQTDLGIVGGRMFMPADSVRIMGGVGAYMAREKPKFLKDAGNVVEKRIIYDNFLARAIEFGNAEDAGGTAAESGNTGLYSMIVYKEIPGENTGLYSRKGYGDGKYFETEYEANGGLINENGIPGYAAIIKNYMGIQVLNNKGVAAIVNISESKLPTTKMISETLLTARATPKNTKIFMHPRLLAWLGDEYKKEILQTTNNDKGYNTLLSYWNEIPIITSNNFLEGAETKITLS